MVSGLDMKNEQHLRSISHSLASIALSLERILAMRVEEKAAQEEINEIELDPEMLSWPD